MSIKRENQVFQNVTAHHLPTNVEPLSQTQIGCPNENSPKSTYWAGCSLVWNIPVVNSGHLCQLCSLPVSFGLSSLSEHETMKKCPWLKINTAWQKAKTLACHQHHSHCKSKTQHWNRTEKKLTFFSSWNQDRYFNSLLNSRRLVWRILTQ